MFAWTRSTPGAECLFKARQSASAVRHFRSVSQNTRLLNRAAAYLRGTQPSNAPGQYPRHVRSVGQQTTRHPRIFSAAFSTCDIRLFEGTLSSQSPKKKVSPNQARPERQLRKMVGKACPGCGSTFQIHHPDKPGYLARDYKGLDNLETAPAKITFEEPGKLALKPNANAMSHTDYEEHLKSLDPDILEKMGLSAAVITSPKASDLSDPTPKANSAIARSNEEKVKDWKSDRKPIPQPLITSRLICYRCHSILHHFTLQANATQSPSPPKMFASSSASEPRNLGDLVRTANRIMLLVVDLMDFPLSLPQVLVDELLKRKKKKWETSVGPNIPTPIIIVANKFDLLPHGTNRADVTQRIREYLVKHDLHCNIYDIQVVSAKNPSGDEIRRLIKKIKEVWPRACKGSVAIVGAENVGKSQLLNAILMEGVRKGRPYQHRDEAEQNERHRKLNVLLGDDDVPGGSGDEEWGIMTGNNPEAKDNIQAEAKTRGVKKYNEYNVTVSSVPGTTMGRIKVPLNVLSKFMDADYKDIAKKWILDTPGFKHTNGHISDWLTLEELKVSLPTKMLKPMSFVLEEGKSIFLGGLVRIDCLTIESDARDSSSDMSHTRGSNPQVKVTLFTALPLHKTSIDNADKFMKQTMLGQLSILQPPFGSPERLSVFPGLAPAFDRDVVIVNDPLHYLSKASYQSSEYSFSNIDPFAKLDDRRQTNRRSKVTDEVSRKDMRDAQLQLAGQHGICDLVFSGVGWAMISGKFQGPRNPVTLRVWTPKGQGAMIRDLCLLPELANNPLEKTAGSIRQARKLFQDLPTAQRSESKIEDQ